MKGGTGLDFHIIAYLFFGLLIGLSEFLPVSASGNEYLYTLLLGMQDYTPLLRLLVHIGCLAALLLHCGKRLIYIQQQLRIAGLPAKRRKRQPDMVAVSDGRLLYSAALPMLAAMIISRAFLEKFLSLPIAIAILIASGILVYIPQHYPAGNRESKAMTRLDGVLLGLCSGLCLLPGFSRLGVTVSVGLLRGCDREYILNTSLLLSVVAILVLILIDLLALFSSGFAGITLLVAVICLLAAAIAFAAAYGCIVMVRYLSVRAGFSGFAYYSWGAAMLGFIFYLIT